MLKVKPKKKTNKGASISKTQTAPKKPIVQPEWNSTQSNLDKYKLSQAELVFSNSQQVFEFTFLGSEKSLIDFKA